jgi:hypothetical protein
MSSENYNNNYDDFSEDEYNDEEKYKPRIYMDNKNYNDSDSDDHNDEKINEYFTEIRRLSDIYEKQHDTLTTDENLLKITEIMHIRNDMYEYCDKKCKETLFIYDRIRNANRFADLNLRLKNVNNCSKQTLDKFNEEQRRFTRVRWISTT